MMKQKSRSFCISLKSLSSHSICGALKITQVDKNLQLQEAAVKRCS